MSRTITRTGRQQASLAAGPHVVASVLSDPVAVTHLLGDLLDQRRSRAEPPVRWVIPRISLGLASFDTVLVPTFRRTGDLVRIEAVTTRDSDAGARLELSLDPAATEQGGSLLVTQWRLDLRVPLPRAALRLAGPAIDRTVASTVQSIMRRTEQAVSDAGGS
jgi:hypothetical protein